MWFTDLFILCSQLYVFMRLVDHNLSSWFYRINDRKHQNFDGRVLYSSSTAVSNEEIVAIG